MEQVSKEFIQALNRNLSAATDIIFAFRLAVEVDALGRSPRGAEDASSKIGMSYKRGRHAFAVLAAVQGRKELPKQMRNK